MDTPEQTIALIGILVVTGWMVILCCHWLVSGERSPDPWDAAIDQEIESEDALPICPHCSTPQEHETWFCPHCGSAIGKYGSCLPDVYIFAVGEAVRRGVEQAKPWSPLVVLGYVLVAFGYFSILAPIYCLFLFLNRSRTRTQQARLAAP